MQPENSIQDLLRLQRIKLNLCWTMKILRQATYIVKLSKFVQISMQTSSDFLLERILY